jgi:poly(3-hydroxybutyrate) depolymerase
LVDGTFALVARGTTSWSATVHTGRLAGGSHMVTARATDLGYYTASSPYGTPTQNSTTSAGVAVSLPGPVACTNACTLGQSLCATSTSWQTCAVGPDGCTHWQTALSCPTGSTCFSGGCAPSCTNACPMAGLTRCSAAGDAVEVCDDHLGNGCVQWGTEVACAGAGACSNAACGATTCTNTCRAAGDMRCDPSGSGGYQSCVQGAGGCLSWSATQSCGTGSTCSSGACGSGLVNECSAGATRCDHDSGGVQSCTTAPSGQLIWGAPTACSAGDVCTWGKCRGGCTDQCRAGETRCNAGGQVEACGQYDGNGCLEWPSSTTSDTSCGSNETCVQGLCVSNAENGHHPMPYFYRGEDHAYDVYVPASYVDGTANVPAMLALHGSCEAGMSEALDMGNWATHAETLGILAVAPKGLVHSSSTSGVADPDPTARCWELADSLRAREAQYVLAVLTDAQSRSRIDASKVFTYGESGGAYISCALGMLHSDVIHGVGMLDGECDDISTDPTYIAEHVPFYFLDGANDYLYASWVQPRYSGSVPYIVGLNPLGYRAELVAVATRGHEPLPNYMLPMWQFLNGP